MIFIELIQQLPESSTSKDIGDLLNEYSHQFSDSKFSLENRMSLINSCFAQNSVEDIIEKLVNHIDWTLL
jgi:hypothetical protein